MSKIHFSIAKSFGRLQLIPESNGLRMWYVPSVNGELAPESAGACDILIPLEAVGGLWATAQKVRKLKKCGGPRGKEQTTTTLEKERLRKYRIPSSYEKKTKLPKCDVD